MSDYLNTAAEQANKIFDKEEMKKFLAQFAIDSQKSNIILEQCRQYVNHSSFQSKKNIDSTCMKCGYYNKEQSDFYKCHINGSCPRYI